MQERRQIPPAWACDKRVVQKPPLTSMKTTTESVQAAVSKCKGYGTAEGGLIRRSTTDICSGSEIPGPIIDFIGPRQYDRLAGIENNDSVGIDGCDFVDELVLIIGQSMLLCLYGIK